MSDVWPPLAAVIAAAQEYPAWVCLDCGRKYGKHDVGVATWHEDTCGICGRVTGVTEARDFGCLREGWRAP
jgi:hypothetical protein